jgi:hypothetical protein
MSRRRMLLIAALFTALCWTPDVWQVDMPQAHAGPLGYGTDNYETYAFAACENIGVGGFTPAQAEKNLLNGNQHGGHITPAQAHAIVMDAVAAGCQNAGRS